MNLERHFNNRSNSVKKICDMSKRINELSIELKKSKDVKEFGEILILLKYSLKNNLAEVESLLK